MPRNPTTQAMVSRPRTWPDPTEVPPSHGSLRTDARHCGGEKEHDYSMSDQETMDMMRQASVAIEALEHKTQTFRAT